MRISVAAFIATSILIQQPAGDRPAGNTRGTRSVVMARHGASIGALSRILDGVSGLLLFVIGGMELVQLIAGRSSPLGPA